MNDVLKLIHTRRAVRDFKPDKVDDLDLATILEAGRQAPSGWNGQTWHFTVVQKRSVLDRLVDAAREILPDTDPELVAEFPWLVAPQFHYYYQAPLVIFVSGLKSSKFSVSDGACATMNMLFAAESLGLQTCIVTTALDVFRTKYRDEFLKDLNIPDGYEPMYALVIGYTSEDLPMAAPRKDDIVNYVN